MANSVGIQLVDAEFKVAGRIIKYGHILEAMLEMVREDTNTDLEEEAVKAICIEQLNVYFGNMAASLNSKPDVFNLDHLFDTVVYAYQAILMQLDFEDTYEASRAVLIACLTAAGLPSLRAPSQPDYSLKELALLQQTGTAEVGCMDDIVSLLGSKVLDLINLYENQESPAQKALVVEQGLS